MNSLPFGNCVILSELFESISSSVKWVYDTYFIEVFILHEPHNLGDTR